MDFYFLLLYDNVLLLGLHTHDIKCKIWGLKQGKHWSAWSKHLIQHFYLTCQMSDLTEHVEQAALARVGASSDDHLNTAAQALSSPLIWKVVFHIGLQLPNSCVHCSRQNVAGLKNNIQTSLTNLSNWCCNTTFCKLKCKGFNFKGRIKHHLYWSCTNSQSFCTLEVCQVEGKGYFSWPLSVALQPICNSQRKEMVCDRFVPWRTKNPLNSPEKYRYNT